MKILARVSRDSFFLRVFALSLLLVPSRVWSEERDADRTHQYRIRLTITSELDYPNTPMDPVIDFQEWIRKLRAPGVLDPNSIEVVNLATGDSIPHALSEDFAYSNQGRVEFVVENPKHRAVEIRFHTATRRPSLKPQRFTPQIGVGDLVRYNANQPRPITVACSPGLYDLNGDGQLDLTGTWNYAYRPGSPWDGIICFPGTSKTLQFGDLARLRQESKEADTPQFFSHIYMGVDFADWNRDGLLDLVTTRRGTNSAEFYLNTGKRDPGGLPRFQSAGSVPVAGWQACRAVDLDGDRVMDLVVDGEYIRNDNPNGWPFRAAKATKLDAGKRPCFLDVDRDGRLDAVCLQGGQSVQPDFFQVVWRKNRGGLNPKFGKERRLAGLDVSEVSAVGAWHHKNRSGLIVQHRAFQELSVFELSETSQGFQKVGRAESVSAVLSLSDQAWPCLCDWDDDGDQDLLVGGGYGWPRIVINDGTQKRPQWRTAERILSDGTPIRLTRNELLGDPKNWHDMGYPYPDFVDWDNDGLKDLVCPNETNRIFWYRNIGTEKQPSFGPRQQILCDEFPDSPNLRKLSATRANDPESNNGVYPLEKERPFFWRTGAAFRDFTGDGLTDLVTLHGHKRVATLFTQYRHQDGTPRLRKDRVLKLQDGTPINDAIVKRKSHWTESFRAVDWNSDGLTDLVYSVAGSHGGTKDGGSIYLLLNVGTKTTPSFSPPITMCCFGEPIRITNHGPHPWPGDFDGDGNPDLITCVEWSVYPFYSYAALMMKERPKYTLEVLKQ